MFADSCNFNNVYIVIAPKTVSNTTNPTSSLTPAQKELIISTLRSLKTLTSEVVILDPVFITSDICLTLDGSADGSVSDVDNTELYVVKKPNSQRDSSSIATDIVTTFTNYFNRENVLLGQEISINTLTNQILSIDGVETFYTRRKDNNAVRYNGLSMLVWNPIYPTDKELITKDTAMEYFKYLFLNNKEKFSDRVVVEAETTIYETIEY